MCISYLYTIEMLEAFWLLWLGWGVVLDFFLLKLLKWLGSIWILERIRERKGKERKMMEKFLKMNSGTEPSSNISLQASQFLRGWNGTSVFITCSQTFLATENFLSQFVCNLWYLSLSCLVVATDDEKIAECCRGFGADVIMTSESCRNGRLLNFSFLWF